MILADLIKAQLIKADSNNPSNNNPDMSWQREMEQKQHNKPRKPGQVLPKGTFTKSPGGIAQIVKNHSPDYGTAVKKLDSYINRSGRNLEGADRERLHQSKEALKNQYGDQEKPTTTSSVKRVAIAEQPIYCLPEGHNKDDGMVNLLKEVPDNREKWTTHDQQMRPSPALDAADPKATMGSLMELGNSLAKASILNSVQDPNQRMSSVEEPEVVDAGSTSTNNLEETPIAPEKMEKVADATFDSLDTKFEDVNPISNSAYARTRDVMAGALKHIMVADKWSSDVKTKKHPPEGLFKDGSADEIASWLKKSHKGDHGKASSALNFYINRAGKNLSDERKKVLESVKGKI
jgi:Protein of unknown function (DUF3175)